MHRDPAKRDRSLAAAFDPRANALNFVRLCLAGGVIVWHSFPLSGTTAAGAPLRQILGLAFVDGFFAISGFLLTRSWERDPHVGRFLAARVLRIFPAFWVCLLVTAFVFAPLSKALSGGGGAMFGPENFGYVLKNLTLVITQPGIAGTLDSVPFPAVWNGSLWTLQWEFLCYLGLLLLGCTGLLRRRWTLLTLFVMTLLVSIALQCTGQTASVIAIASRFGLMFLAGALLWRYRANIPVTAIGLIFAGAVVAGSSLLPNYRLVAGIPLAYLVVGIGARLRSPWLRFPEDLSYGLYVYAFPLQQLLATVGVYHLGVAAYAVAAAAATTPFAAMSWFVVEKPAMRLRPRRRDTVGAPRRSDEANGGSSRRTIDAGKSPEPTA